MDDGKSTLIGRLLHDTKTVFEDQLQAVVKASRRYGDGETNLALLTDGLRAEREQGITIDVAHRYFATPAAQLHRRRHARARAVHAQHGHRRVHLATSPSCSSMPATVCSTRPAATRSSRRWSACRPSCSP